MIEIQKSETADSRTAIGNPTKEELLNSSLQHIGDVQKGLDFFRCMLCNAGKRHDFTKVDEAGIDAFYEAFAGKMIDDEFKAGPWFQRHIKEERHHMKDYMHPDINLIDVIERVVDIVMAGMGRSGVVYEDMLDAEMLQTAYANTIELLKNNVKVVE